LHRSNMQCEQRISCIWYLMAHVEKIEFSCHANLLRAAEFNCSPLRRGVLLDCENLEIFSFMHASSMSSLEVTVL
jgi:hypothetical protein